ncbi:DNA-packaging protein [Shimia biformata]|uniref:DNA-packaging protein n=1 Tax=Shimia biformata TaxID=1294299 RepID=UPI00194FDC41|nr:terminase family protein [Shimia biformata]
MTENELLALPYLFDLWAHAHQMPPDGDWKSWVILGGRGAGKTRAGAEWVRSMVEGARPMDRGRARRLALVGETVDQVREIMVFGESGILQCSPPDRRPAWEAGRKRLVWPNGATAAVFSAHDPESLRGPQFDAAWADELAKWKKLRETWDMLQFGLRLGDHPQQCITTTPRNVDVLKELLALPGTVTTTAATEANRAHLADSFLAEVRARYDGTRLGRQELDGVLLDDVEGALWTTAMIEVAIAAEPPDLDRVVVAVDPPVTGHAKSDECGIVVAGVSMRGAPVDWRAHVLADCSVRGASPSVWAEAAVEAFHRFDADRIVAEVNQGGDLVQSVIRQIDGVVPFKAVRASKSKFLRAEPVASIYERGRVSHARGLGALEDQMCRMTAAGYRGKGSPDRLDALVWALTELLVDPANKRVARPGIRSV